jgi:MerR family transcriptional regulator, copper efflux regulator
MRITEASRRLGTSPRMLRYRESLGLLPEVRDQPRSPVASRPRAAAPPAQAPHRQFTQQDLDAVAIGLAIERRYDVSPAALAFGLRVLAEPGVRAEVAELARRIGRIRPPAVRALDFEQERAQRLLNMPANRGPAPGRHERTP